MGLEVLGDQNDGSDGAVHLWRSTLVLRDLFDRDVDLHSWRAERFKPTFERLLVAQSIRPGVIDEGELSTRDNPELDEWFTRLNVRQWKESIWAMLVEGPRNFDGRSCLGVLFELMDEPVFGEIVRIDAVRRGMRHFDVRASLKRAIGPYFAGTDE